MTDLHVAAGSHTLPPMDKVVWGVPATEAVAAELDRLGATKLFIIASGTLSKKTNVITELRDTLGDRCVGLFDECQEHSPLESVLSCVQAVNEANPDMLPTVGGGSVIDTAKIAQLALTAGVNDMPGLRAQIGVPTTAPSRIRQLVVPTTLSGSEFTKSAGSLDREQKVKVGFTAPDLCGRVVILDPAITLHTPEALWLSTAIRSIDQGAATDSLRGRRVG